MIHTKQEMDAHDYLIELFNKEDDYHNNFIICLWNCFLDENNEEGSEVNKIFFINNKKELKDFLGNFWQPMDIIRSIPYLHGNYNVFWTKEDADKPDEIVMCNGSKAEAIMNIVNFWKLATYIAEKEWPLNFEIIEDKIIEMNKLEIALNPPKWGKRHISKNTKTGKEYMAQYLKELTREENRGKTYVTKPSVWIACKWKNDHGFDSVLDDRASDELDWLRKNEPQLFCYIKDGFDTITSAMFSDVEENV